MIRVSRLLSIFLFFFVVLLEQCSQFGPAPAHVLSGTLQRSCKRQHGADRPGLPNVGARPQLRFVCEEFPTLWNQGQTIILVETMVEVVLEFNCEVGSLLSR